VNAEQKRHVLTQLERASSNVVGAAEAVRVVGGLIVDDSYLTSASILINQARERLEIAQYAINGLLGVKS
jgi:hypothetical protein